MRSSINSVGVRSGSNKMEHTLSTHGDPGLHRRDATPNLFSGSKGDVGIGSRVSTWELKEPLDMEWSSSNKMEHTLSTHGDPGLHRRDATPNLFSGSKGDVGIGSRVSTWELKEPLDMEWSSSIRDPTHTLDM